MLREIFLFSAVVGGAVFLVQFLMSLMALGGHRFGHRASHRAGVPGATPGGAPRIHGTLGTPGTTATTHTALTHRVGAPSAVTTRVVVGHAPAGGGGGATGAHARPGLARHFGHRGARTASTASTPGAPGAAGRGQGAHVALTTAVHFLMALLDLQALVAGTTAFGLAGLAGTAFGFHAGAAVGIAAVVALLAMALVVVLLQSIENMDEDGTVRLEQAIGKVATVYLSIPAQHAGLGKVTVTVQERSVELPAVTYHDSPITTGAKVVVVDLEPPDIAQVIPADRVPGLEVKL